MTAPMFAAALSWLSILLPAHVALTLAGVGLGSLVERSALARTHTIQGDPVPPGQLRREAIANVTFIVVVSAGVSLGLGADIIRWGPDTWLRGIATFFAASVVFDTYFYGLHRALHLRPLMRFHRLHHQSRVRGPLTAQSVSAVEALGWAIGYVGVPWLLSQIAPISMVGYLVYLTYATLGNILGHLNVELAPPAMTRSFTVWLAHAYVFHALHHARFTKHFGFGSTFMDRLGGTEWPDWTEAYAQVTAGRPLHSHGKLDPPG